MSTTEDFIYSSFSFQQNILFTSTSVTSLIKEPVIYVLIMSKQIVLLRFVKKEPVTFVWIMSNQREPLEMEVLFRDMIWLEN